MKKKLLSLVCALALTISLLPAAQALEGEGTRAAEALASLGLVTGTGAGYAAEDAATQEQAAARVGKSRPAVANALRLLSLSPAVLELVKDGSLSAGHARALLPVKDEAQQLSIAQKVMALGLSVRQTEALCKKLTKQAQPVKEQPPRVDYLAECEKELTAGLGRKVRIVSGKRKGRIELEYYGQDDLQQLYDALHTIRKKEHH